MKEMDNGPAGFLFMKSFIKMVIEGLIRLHNMKKA